VYIEIDIVVWISLLITHTHTHKTNKSKCTHLNGLFSIILLHNAHCGIGNQDEENDDGLDIGRLFFLFVRFEERKDEGHDSGTE
jgi:hypothetical protein